MRKVFSGLLVGLVLSWGGIASAAPSYCNSGGGDLDTSVNDDTPALRTSDMTYNGNPATDCYGAVTKDNDTAGDINALLWDTGWQFAARDNIGTGGDTSNEVAGILWSLTATLSDPRTWTLTGIDQNGPTASNLGDAFDFVGVLKGGNGWAAYLFEGVTFDGNDGGTWKISFLNKGGQVPDLSHMSIYAREGDIPFIDVPEPGSIALAGLGLLGLALTRRRRTPPHAH